eukprot:scaffold19195_cov35-Tisochrysis_lutea.AAC.3
MGGVLFAVGSADTRTKGQAGREKKEAMARSACNPKPRRILKGAVSKACRACLCARLRVV